MTSSSANQSTTKATDSYSYGLQENLEGKLTFGSPKKSHVSLGLQLAAQQTFEDGIEEENGNSVSHQIKASVETGSSDRVWYDESRLNIHSYPVLGKAFCPAEKSDNCGPSEKAPLVIQFSVVDRVTNATAAGNQIEWYQPVREYGNVLPYPASLSQLIKLYPDMKKLASATTFSTDGSTSTVKTSWSSSTSQSESVSSARRFGEQGGVSVSGAIAVFGGGLEVDVSGSQEFENLNGNHRFRRFTGYRDPEAEHFPRTAYLCLRHNAVYFWPHQTPGCNR